MTRVPAIALALLLGAPVAPARANPPPVPPAVRRALTEATVLVLPAECGGALAESPDLVVTALHCIDRGDALRVRTRSGAVLDARLEATDTVADQAVLLLEHPAAVTPLAIARRLPIAGTVVYFQGNPSAHDRRRRASTGSGAASPCHGCPTRSSPASAGSRATPARHSWTAPRRSSDSCMAAPAARSRRLRRTSGRSSIACWLATRPRIDAAAGSSPRARARAARRRPPRCDTSRTGAGRASARSAGAHGSPRAH